MFDFSWYDTLQPIPLTVLETVIRARSPSFSAIRHHPRPIRTHMEMSTGTQIPTEVLVGINNDK